MASSGGGQAGDHGEPDPRARLMQEVAEEMDAIEADFGDNYQIGRVITVVEVIRPNEEVNLRVRAGQLPWVTLGMLRFAQKALEGQIPGPQ
ncbi:MAG TPA: hypothetical protein VNY31_02985 [Solirubrobacteraceae bacterium]|jgi:hypothetical protein|nr:hypothetical protein [Solirubrobacteraceae bacterium]